MDPLKSIKTGFFSRNWQLTKMASRALVPLLKNSNFDAQKLFQEFIGKDVEKWPKELGMLKGSLLKAGQLISMYSEYFLPEEFRKTLRKLQASTHYIEFDVIKSQLNAKQLAMGVSATPFAAASIGQVHLSLAGDKVVKIQYPGIKKAIDWDLFFLKQILKLAKALPQDIDFEPLFAEVKDMLTLEMDYSHELMMQEKFYKFYKDHKFIAVPRPNIELSSDKVLVSEYIPGDLLSSDNVLQQSQIVRDQIGTALLEIFLTEIFELGIVQTDAHGGNYLFYQDKLYLIDFGSVKFLTSDMQQVYKDMIKAGLSDDKNSFIAALNKFQEDYNFSFELDLNFAWQYFQLATSPLRKKVYDWGECRLPDQLMEMAKSEFKNIKVKNPPFHFIFIDRKIAGLYMLLKSLKAQTVARDIVEKFIK